MKTGKPRQWLPRDERRSEVLQVATHVFFEKGYEAASLQDIADRIGIRKASLYYYFASKEDLLHSVLSAIISEAMLQLRSGVDLAHDPLTRLWTLVADHVRHLCAHPKESAVFLRERKRIRLERRRELLSDEYAFQLLFVAAIKDGLAAGQIRPDIDPNLAAFSILGSTNSLNRWFRPGGDLMPDHIGEQFATMAINGLASEVASRTWVPPSRQHPAPASVKTEDA